MIAYKIPTEEPGTDDILAFAVSIKSNFFEPETMKFFGSILEAPVYSDDKGGAFFVTSEQLTKEVRDGIISGWIKKIDEQVDELTGEETKRAQGIGGDEPRFWQVRYASFNKESIRTEPSSGKHRYASLQGADEAARQASEEMRMWDER